MQTPINLEARLEYIQRQIALEERRLLLFQGSSALLRVRIVIARLKLRELELIQELAEGA